MRIESKRGGTETKKEEFPDTMENMLSRNSFPQICVVSVIEFLRSVENKQEYEGSVAVFSTACMFSGIRSCYES